MRKQKTCTSFTLFCKLLIGLPVKQSGFIRNMMTSISKQGLLSEVVRDSRPV